MRKILVCLCIMFIEIGMTYSNGKENGDSMNNELARVAIQLSRRNKPFFFTKRAKLARYLYDNVYMAGSGYPPVDDIQKLIDKGADPNFCIGDEGWISSNPLLVLANIVNLAYYYVKDADSDSDIKMFHTLVAAGADVTLFPYIWYRVYINNNVSLKDIKSWARKYGESDYQIEKHLELWIAADNRLLEEFIKAGADPDMRGDPYPFDGDYKKMTDEKAAEYFEKGTRPINEAIKKGMQWESQVDLLLKYVKLDENSLKAAGESGDEAMIKKIDGLWAKQQQANK